MVAGFTLEQVDEVAARVATESRTLHRVQKREYFKKSTEGADLI